MIYASLYIDHLREAALKKDDSMLKMVSRLEKKDSSYCKTELDCFFKKYEITLFEQIYEKGFHWVFRNKIFSLSIVSILIISNIFLFANLKKEKLPAFKQNELRTDIDWNRNISIEENKERVLLLLKSFNGEVIESNVMIGEQQYMLNKESELSSSQAQLYLKLKDTVSITGLKRKINHYFRNKYPEASVSLAPPSNIFEKVPSNQSG